LNAGNPAASVFKIAAGEPGYLFFGVVMWSAAITSVVGAAYTSVSFLRTLHILFEKYYRLLISFIIIFSTIFFVIAGKPVQLLVMVGALNGLILPVSLAVILIASHKRIIVGTYSHPYWMRITGWIVVCIMSWLSFVAIKDWVL
jgi:Mn2+/Fe2+ NRAMP family transporter